MNLVAFLTSLFALAQRFFPSTDPSSSSPSSSAAALLNDTDCAIDWSQKQIDTLQDFIEEVREIEEYVPLLQVVVPQFHQLLLAADEFVDGVELVLNTTETSLETYGGVQVDAAIV